MRPDSYEEFMEHARREDPERVAAVEEAHAVIGMNRVWYCAEHETAYDGSEAAATTLPGCDACPFRVRCHGDYPEPIRSDVYGKLKQVPIFAQDFNDRMRRGGELAVLQHAKLSPVEINVMRMVTAGKEGRAAAREMGMSYGAFASIQRRAESKLRELINCEADDEEDDLMQAA